MLNDREVILDELRMSLLRAQQKIKAYADRKQREVEVQVDNLVILEPHPYREKSLAKRKPEKLSRYYGLFKVIARI